MSHHHHHHHNHEHDRGIDADEAFARLRIDEDRHHSDEPYRDHHRSAYEYEHPHHQHHRPLEYEERPYHTEHHDRPIEYEYVAVPHHREGHHKREASEYEYVPHDHHSRFSEDDEPRHHNSHRRRPPEHDDESDRGGRQNRSSSGERDSKSRSGYDSPSQNDFPPILAAPPNNPQSHGPPPNFQNGPSGFRPPPMAYQDGPPRGYGPPPNFQNGPPPMGFIGPPQNYNHPPLPTMGNMGRPQGYGTPPPPFQNGPTQGYGPPPPPGYQGGPPQSFGPPQFQGGPVNSPIGPVRYQNGSPMSFQQGPPMGPGGPYQQPPQGYQGGFQGFQGPTQGPPQGPPSGFQPRPQGDYQGGPGIALAAGAAAVGASEFSSSHPQQANHQSPSYVGGPPQEAQHPYTSSQKPLRRKSLLIGINYVGTQHQLRGCQQDVQNMKQFLNTKGYSSDPRSQVVMRDDAYTDPRGPYWPTGKNILAAMHWLISEPNTCNFLHYSGHGSQVEDPEDEHESGYEDTIVPVDFEANGQIESERLHRTLVSALAPNSTLFIIFDCCHSGSAVELPFVYRTDEDGQIKKMDNLKTGIKLIAGASTLMTDGFTMDKLAQARSLFAGANTFFKQLQHSDEEEEEGVGEVTFGEDWSEEHKFVTMYSGCRDDQTSADAVIGGASVGAMSWAFLETMKKNPNPTYLSTLQHTRDILDQSHYQQVPQLSIGFKEFDLDQPLRF